MSTASKRVGVALVGTVFLLALSAGPAAGARRHTRLLRSIPAQDSVITALPKRMQLWFSEPIELAVSRVRIEGADAKQVALAPLAQDTTAGAPVSAPMPASLTDGAYTVHWSTASKDGHVVRGSFAFRLKTR